MINALHILWQAIKDYEKKPHEEDSTHLQSFLQDACTYSLGEINNLYRQYTEHHLAAYAVRHCYRSLTRMHDTLYHERPKDDLLLKTLASMIEHFEISYESYFQHESILPRYAQEKLHREANARLHEVLVKLRKKKIPSVYLSELSSAVNSLFTAGKLPELKFSHRQYIYTFLTALEEMATDHRKKDWTERFLFILVNYNFNHMGIFNRWREQQEELLTKTASYMGKEKLLTQQEGNLRLHIPEPFYTYDPRRPSLATYMHDYIRKTREVVEKAMEENPLIDDEPILSTLNSDEMTVYFHCAYKADLLKYPTKRKAAKAFATYVRSKTGRTISYKTLEKFDRPALEPAAYNMRKKMKHMLTYLEEEFPF